MASDVQFAHMKYPVGIAFVLEVHDSTFFQVAWFVLPVTQHSAAERRGAPKDFKYTNKFLTWEKEWIDHNWWRPANKKDKPSKDQIMKAWHKDKAHRDWILPIQVPQPEPDDVIAKDKLRLEMKWITKELLPLCISCDCMN